jgi:hypothetical protein
MRWPFHLEGVALDRGSVAVAREAPGLNHFAALLLNLRQGNECALRLAPEFLLEFAVSGLQRFLVRVQFALGNTPHAGVFVLEKRSAWMNEQKLKLLILHPIHQQSCAWFWHPFDEQRKGAAIKPAAVSARSEQ